MQMALATSSLITHIQTQSEVSEATGLYYFQSNIKAQ